MQPLIRATPNDLERMLGSILDDFVKLEDYTLYQQQIETLARYGLKSDGLDGDYRSEKARYILHFLAGVKLGMRMRNEDGSNV